MSMTAMGYADVGGGEETFLFIAMKPKASAFLGAGSGVSERL
jgi:hypothetical protein